MAAFDTALTPKQATPTQSTANVTLFTSSGDCSVLIDVVNLSTAAVTSRVGLVAGSTVVQWKVFNTSITAGDGIASLGPYFLDAGSLVVVRSGTANNVQFSMTGVESSP